MYRYLLLAVLLSIYSFSCFAQNPTKDAKKRAEADSVFALKQYAEAIPLYSHLLKLYPRDKEIQFALGVCKLLGTKNYDEALSLLKDASTGDVPNIVYYYLAEAYRNTYHFDNAIEYYRRYMVNGPTDDVDSDIIEVLVNLCENGNYLTRYVFEPNVLDAKKVALNDVHLFYSIAPRTGVFIKVPDKLLSSVDKKLGYHPIMYYPTAAEVGDYIYFSSYGKTDSYGIDIYRTQLLKGNVWSKPEPLSDVVNTKQDEQYPYMAPDGVTLYFASKGHYGMGGYDIYRTVFDKVAKQWSTPENLGFPFSSPFDDFLYVPSVDDTLIAFATQRNCTSDSVQVILMSVHDNQVRHSAKSVEQIVEYSSLNIKKQVTKQQATSTPKEVKKNQEAQVKPQKPASFRAVENDPEYSRAIAKGFEEQMKADSSRIKLEKLREKFDYVETAEQRIKLEKQVSTVEKTMLEAQKQADLMFVRASQIEQEYLTGKRKPAGKTESTFATDNPEYICKAQFATTVFQDNEISKLTQVEEQYPTIVKQRNSAIEKRKLYEDCAVTKSDTNNNACANLYNSMTSAMKQYSNSLAQYYEQKYPIYDECVHVAVVKSGSDGAEIRELINTSTAHFRAASTIMNNLSIEGAIESAFEASLLRELGLIRMDYVFAKVWGMKLMEKRLVERIILLDVELFGTSKLVVDNDSEPQLQPIADEPEIVDVPKIERIEQIVEIHQFAVKSEVPTDFGVVDTMVYNATNPIPIVKAQPDGIVYRIQIGAYGTPRQPNFFKNMVPISGIRAGKVTKYYIGCLTKYSDAEKALQVVKQRGFKDAFIVAWYNNKTIAVTRAKSLENELPETQNTTDDRIIKTSDKEREFDSRLYIVQIGSYAGSMPEKDLKTVKTLVSGKEITRKIDAQGLYVYSVGSFSSVSDAERIKDNLVASGLLKAIVVTIDI